MTRYQSELFNQLLDINWELETGNHNDIVVQALQDQYRQVQHDLETDMGKEEYQAFILNAQRMFS